MKTIVLEKQEIYNGDLILVNTDHALRAKEIKLMPVDPAYPAIQMKQEVVDSLQKLLEKIGAGDRILPVSGYRPVEEQIAIYEDSLKENGREFTEKYVALPDHSEHQTGLAIDLGLAKEEIDFIRPDFPYEGICQKFREMAAAYGWIERYAKDKTQVTGIAQEPWHFRYVGCPHAVIMAEKNLALEEYIDFLRQFDTKHPYVYQAESGTKSQIYYQPVQGEQTTICIPDGYTVHISGNNVDGFIVTRSGVIA